ncbi:MAG: hypothetical protein Q7U20_08530 [Caulobacter sp.]|nr:hypothetical protein [Caulobacter sp.]
MLDLVSRKIRKHDGDFLRAVVYMASIQASRAPLRGEGNPEPARVFSVRAIAQSMAIPYETTRRKIAELEAAGLARRVGSRGYTVAPAVFEGEAYRAECDATWRALQRLIIDLRALNFDFSAFAGGSSLTAVRDLGQADLADAAAVLVNDFQLRVLETGIQPHGSMLDAAIISTLILTNAELLTHDPELAQQYSGAATPPPDHLRKPATITEVATALGLTHETVRRRFNRYCQLGWARRVTGGYLMTVERLQDPDVLNGGLMISQRFLQLLQSLRLLGVNPATLQPS